MKPPRWSQFSLRTMLALITLFATIFWGGLQVKWVRERHAAMRWLEGRGGSWRYAVDPKQSLPWTLAVLGEPSVAVLSLVSTPEEHKTKVPELGRLFPEAEINEVIDYSGQWTRFRSADLNSRAMQASVPITRARGASKGNNQGYIFH